jgi:hypothetical protein
VGLVEPHGSESFFGRRRLSGFSRSLASEGSCPHPVRPQHTTKRRSTLHQPSAVADLQLHRRRQAVIFS